MSYDMVRFERGQVWMIRYKSSYDEPVGREIKKDRPWLILSVGTYNHGTGMITAVPLTSRDTVRYPSQVLINNHNGRNNVIMCEQIKSFDVKSGEYLLEYMGTVSDEVLDKVDVSVSIHLGLHYSPITLQSLYDSMESIIKSIAFMEKDSHPGAFTDNDVRDFTEKFLMEVMNTTNMTAYSELACTEETEDNLTLIEDVSVVDNSNQSKDTARTTGSSKRTRNKWDRNKCLEFLNDAENFPMSQVMEKWNLSKKAKFYTTKHYVKSLIENGL